MKCFIGLQHLGLERHTCTFNRLLLRVARGKEWEKVLHVFRHMLDTGVPVDTETYNTLIGACIRGTLSSPLFHSSLHKEDGHV